MELRTIRIGIRPWFELIGVGIEDGLLRQVLEWWSLVRSRVWLCAGNKRGRPRGRKFQGEEPNDFCETGSLGSTGCISVRRNYPVLYSTPYPGTHPD